MFEDPGDSVPPENCMGAWRAMWGEPSDMTMAPTPKAASNSATDKGSANGSAGDGGSADDGKLGRERVGLSTSDRLLSSQSDQCHAGCTVHVTVLN